MTAAGAWSVAGRSGASAVRYRAAFAAMALALVAVGSTSCELLYAGAEPFTEVVSAEIEDINDETLAGWFNVCYRVTNLGTKDVPSGSRVEFRAMLYDTSKGERVAVDFWSADFPLGGLPPGRSVQAVTYAKYYMEIDIGNVDASRSSVLVRGVRMRP